MKTQDLLKRLVNASGVSGREENIREAIRKEIEPYCDEITVDALGNLIAHKRGKGKKIMISAHMDEIGYFATHITEGGFIKVNPIGGINYLSSAYTTVRSERGVVGMLAPSNKEGVPSTDSVFIDIGAKDKKSACDRVRVGDFFVHTPTLKKLLGTRYIGRPLDNRAGCCALIEALRLTKSENDLYFVFTVQEEVGTRGARPVAYQISPDYALAVDVARVDGKPGTDTYNVKLGGGPTIKIKDGSVICNHDLVLRLREIAKGAGIKYQDELLSKGGTDTSALQVAGHGTVAGAICIPCAFMHTVNEMIDLNDIKNTARLLALVASEL